MAVRRFALPFLLFLVVVTSIVVAQRPKAASRRRTTPQYPNIIVVTLDTTRADRMGFLGSKRRLTPNLDAMAQQSIIFNRAYSHVPLTTASHTAILFVDFRSKTSQKLVDLAQPDPEKMQKLQALGYVGSDASPAQDEKKLTGIDPKARIEISNLLHDAMFDVEDARYEEAIPLLERALEAQPDMPVANMQHGMAQARLRHFGKAVEPLRKAVTLQPGQWHGPL